MFFVLINKKLFFHITVTAVDKTGSNQWAMFVVFAVIKCNPDFDKAKLHRGDRVTNTYFDTFQDGQ